jgi:acetyltransferase-like isoleucine patch superfamily enzyme
VDDYGGRHLTNSTLPGEVLGVQAAPVRIGRYVPVGAGTLILPGVEIEEGAAVGAMSLVRTSLPGWRIYAGNPLQELGERSRDLLALAESVHRSEAPL